MKKQIDESPLDMVIDSFSDPEEFKKAIGATEDVEEQELPDKESEDDLLPEEEETETKFDFDQPEEEETDEVDESEEAGVTTFFDAFSEALGWEVEDDKKPNSVESLIDYMREVIDDNSKPAYASEEVEKLDEFIRNGGSFEEFYNKTTEATNYDRLDIDDEETQKRVVSEYLKLTGHNDSQIKRKLERFEDSGLLEDEASDSLELLKEHHKKEQEKLLQEQEQERIREEEAQKQKFEEITSTVNNLAEIRGIKIPKEDRKKILDYAFKPGIDGQTQFQKDYEKNATKTFIETVYFTMKGDALLKSAKTSGESSAVQKLKQTLKTSTKKGGSKQVMDNDSPVPLWEAASSFFGR